MKNDEIQMRKRNMKLYPNYTKIACDYLFYYTIDKCIRCSFNNFY